MGLGCHETTRRFLLNVLVAGMLVCMLQFAPTIHDSSGGLGAGLLLKVLQSHSPEWLDPPEESSVLTVLLSFESFVPFPAQVMSFNPVEVVRSCAHEALNALLSAFAPAARLQAILSMLKVCVWYLYPPLECGMVLRS